jgi:hypothetical protein
LRQQVLVALLLLAASRLAWLGVRARRRAPVGAGAQRRGREKRSAGLGAPAPAPAEPAGRRVLRIGFGLLWLFDGLLQAQPQMAAGLPGRVIEPVAASSPNWVQHVVNWATAMWIHHPVPAAAAAVWVQVGIGAWLLLADRGIWSRLAGLASLGWGLAVWVFGESFGGLFTSGLSWLTGAPGAALIYAVAGALIALPERAWRAAWLGRLTLTGLGLFLTGMAVLQAWPGRGFWDGTYHGRPGTLTGAVQAMSELPQPRFLSSWVADFASFTAGHGLAVNLFAVAALAVAGAAFTSGLPWLIRPATVAFAVLCLADWVLIQDLGFFGGVGTDPNSMIPFALLAIGGYLALAGPGVTDARGAPRSSRGRRDRRDRPAGEAPAGGESGLHRTGVRIEPPCLRVRPPPARP